jgi:hypothetical protein
VILFFVVFHGPKGWQGPLDFQSLVEIPSDEFADYTDVYNIPKQDLMDMAVEAVRPDVREAVMTTYEQIKQEGKLEGKL